MSGVLKSLLRFATKVIGGLAATPAAANDTTTDTAPDIANAPTMSPSVQPSSKRRADSELVRQIKKVRVSKLPSPPPPPPPDSDSSSSAGWRPEVEQPQAKRRRLNKVSDNNGAKKRHLTPSADASAQQAKRRKVVHHQTMPEQSRQDQETSRVFNNTKKRAFKATTQSKSKSGKSNAARATKHEQRQKAARSERVRLARQQNTARHRPQTPPPSPPVNRRPTSTNCKPVNPVFRGVRAPRRATKTSAQPSSKSQSSKPQPQKSSPQEETVTPRTARKQAYVQKQQELTARAEVRAKKRVAELQDQTRQDQADKTDKDALLQSLAPALKRRARGLGLEALLREFFPATRLVAEPTRDQLRKAYRRALLRFHPDKTSRLGLAERCEAEEVYKLLCDRYESDLK